MVGIVKTGVALIAAAVVLIGLTCVLVAGLPGFTVFLFTPGALVLLAGVTAVVAARRTPAKGRP